MSGSHTDGEQISDQVDAGDTYAERVSQGSTQEVPNDGASDGTNDGHSHGSSQ